jgi:hypothetical protein
MNKEKQTYNNISYLWYSVNRTYLIFSVKIICLLYEVKLNNIVPKM